MINSRDINLLHPKVKVMAQAFLEACLANGINVLITSTYRDSESQNELYKIGRTVKGSNIRAGKPMGDVVTKARGGQSFHNWRVAFDFVPILYGKAVWNDDSLFLKCGEIGESVGLEWAGRWKSFKELAHMQYTGGLSLADFQAGKTL